MAYTYVTVDGKRVERNVSEAFRALAAAFKKEFGLSLHVRSGTRTWGEQADLYRKYLRGGTLALHPDSPKAYHVETNPRGPRALDIYDSGRDAGVTSSGNKRSNWIKKNARKYGFAPAGYSFSQVEPWHIEYTGALFTAPPTPAGTGSTTEQEYPDMFIAIVRESDWYLVIDKEAVLLGAKSGARQSGIPVLNFVDDWAVKQLQRVVSGIK